MTKIADVLDGAAELIEYCGWTQNQFGTLREGLCVSGALNAMPAGFDNGEARYFFYSRLHEQLNTDAVTWNDQSDRTEQDVIDKLREIATIAREKGRQS
jgi:hypothetical protein